VFAGHLVFAVGKHFNIEIETSSFSLLLLLVSLASLLLLCLIPVFRTPENLGQAVVDLKLHEKEEENEALSEQLKRMIVKEEEMTRHISDLELRLEDANNEAGSLKISNIELVRNVCLFINTLTVVGVVLGSGIFYFLDHFLTHTLFSPHAL
jgi:F0F1-type ATP synthase assembly protein I